jgi:hypothetical protein
MSRDHPPPATVDSIDVEQHKASLPPNATQCIKELLAREKARAETTVPPLIFRQLAPYSEGFFRRRRVDLRNHLVRRAKSFLEIDLLSKEEKEDLLEDFLKHVLHERKIYISLRDMSKLAKNYMLIPLFFSVAIIVLISVNFGYSTSFTFYAAAICAFFISPFVIIFALYALVSPEPRIIWKYRVRCSFTGRGIGIRVKQTNSQGAGSVNWWFEVPLIFVLLSAIATNVLIITLIYYSTIQGVFLLKAYLAGAAAAMFFVVASYLLIYGLNLLAILVMGRNSFKHPHSQFVLALYEILSLINKKEDGWSDMQKKEQFCYWLEQAADALFKVFRGFRRIDPLGQAEFNRNRDKLIAAIRQKKIEMVFSTTGTPGKFEDWLVKLFKCGIRARFGDLEDFADERKPTTDGAGFAALARRVGAGFAVGAVPAIAVLGYQLGMEALFPSDAVSWQWVKVVAPYLLAWFGVSVLIQVDSRLRDKLGVVKDVLSMTKPRLDPSSR